MPSASDLAELMQEFYYAKDLRTAYKLLAESDDDVRGIVREAVLRGLPAGDVCVWAALAHKERGPAPAQDLGVSQ